MSVEDDVELLEVLAELGPDERRVLLAVARRLAMGRKAYGLLDVQGDRRDWRAEAAEEALDASVYLACELLRATCPRPPATELPDDDEPSRGDLVIVEVDRAVG